jgi:glucose dehydrogenase
MNFSEMKLIWDSQENQHLFAFDQDALRRLIESDARAALRDLSSIELCAIVMLCVLGTAALWDTFFNGQEYFQLIGVAIDFLAAGWLLWRRRVREAALASHPSTLVGILDAAMTRVRTAISRSRDLAICFGLFAVYGLIIRIVIYGWPGSEVKTLVTMIGLVLVSLSVMASERSTHRPRLKRFESLRERIVNVVENDNES